MSLKLKPSLTPSKTLKSKYFPLVCYLWLISKEKEEKETENQNL